MPKGDVNPADSLNLSAREQRLGELINEYFDRRRQGEPITEDAFLANYPEYAGELRDHLRGLDLIEKMGSGEQTLPGASPSRFKGSSAVDPLESKLPPLPTIPGYDIHKQIGRGGMGVVFKAKQVSTKRTVALKVLLDGALASDTARARFEREVALAAALRHPNIIPIYDSGTFDGRMYYAMEHVYGLSLGDYQKAHELPIKNRVRLFVKICNAVSHAHQRGVIHRDLKPTNILVDGNGEPFVLDFGLAKAGSLADANTSITAQIVGTPAYMSPEQASGDPGGIDTRSDVYSLGVVLYELLTGRMPYETNVSMGRILNNIAHAEPAPPEKLDKRIDAELSAIVLKSLEKRKEDRYQSIDSLENDLKNYMSGDPIMARPMTATRLLKKFVHRHRATLVVGAAVLLAITVTARLWMRSIEKKTEQLDQKTKLLEQQSAQLQESKKQKEEETRSAEETEKALEFLLAGLFKNLPPEQAAEIAAELRSMPVQDLRMMLPKLAGMLGRAALPGGAEPTEPLESTTQPALEFDLPDMTQKPSGSSDRILRAMQRAAARAWEQGLAVPMPVEKEDPPTSQPADDE